MARHRTTLYSSPNRSKGASSCRIPAWIPRARPLPPPGPTPPRTNLETNKKNGKPEPIGKAPVDNTMQFLRRQTVLLKPGQHQFDVGISYAQFTNDYPVGLSNFAGGPLYNVERDACSSDYCLSPPSCAMA